MGAPHYRRCVSGDGLLGPAEIRALAERLGIRPTKALGQNFVHDPNTIRRVVRTATLRPDENPEDAAELGLTEQT